MRNSFENAEPHESEGSPPLMVIRTRPALKMSDDHFYDFCRDNADWRIERTQHGDITIMAPTGGRTGKGNARLTAAFFNWADGDDTGIVFDSSTAFRLPKGAVRSPDVSWILKKRWNALKRKDSERFPPLCPDFVLELRSSTDRLPDLQAKMAEYKRNGARLGWLINPPRRGVYIYRPRRAVEYLKEPETLSGELVLPGFILQLAPIWKALED